MTIVRVDQTNKWLNIIPTCKTNHSLPIDIVSQSYNVPKLCDNDIKKLF